MRAIKFLLAAALITACAAKEEEAPAPAPPAGPTLADFAGTWNVKSVLEGTPDTVSSTLAGTADASSWTMSLEGRPNIPMTVSIVGDSLVGQSAEYESVLRKGVQVTTNSVLRLEGGRLVGTSVAHYQTATADSVVRLRMDGTRKP